MVDRLEHPLLGGGQPVGSVRPAAELTTLLAAWDDTRAGRGAAVTLQGEPGIGKSRLAAELLDRARQQGARTATCAALDLGGAAPLGLLLDE